MRVYHFINSVFGLEDLRNRRLKIALISDLNDPFELLGPRLKNPIARQAFAMTKDQLGKIRGMLCFSRDWQNPVQWSHYADGHKGLCLGFDVPNDYLTPVSYNADRFEPDLGMLSSGGSSAEREMIKVLSTKYLHWQYENEMRCFVKLENKDPGSGLYYCDFSEKLALNAVIVGHRSEVSRSQLQEAMTGDLATIPTFKARLAFNSYRIVNQLNSKLWK